MEPSNASGTTHPIKAQETATRNVLAILFDLAFAIFEYVLISLQLWQEGRDVRSSH